MFTRYLFILVTVMLTACGGGSEVASPQPTPPPLQLAPTPEPPPLPSKNESARFLNMASFGANASSVDNVSNIGFEEWLDTQILLPASSHVAYLEALEPTLDLEPDERLRRKERLEAWFTHAITAPDQLRQRVAFALSEIFVVSEVSTFGDDTYGLANYYDLLINNAFGNYRDLLEQVTLSPIMGMYLSMLGNQKPNEAENIRPDENYAREVMQLFSIGLVELNDDGSEKQQNGQSIPTYNQDIIKAFAHVYTGWNFNGVTSDTWWQFYRNYNTMEPMTAVNAFHDASEKQLLNNVIVPANQSAEQDLAMALDNIFNHANVAPFIGEQLIKKLVTSNPSPAYVARISAIFNDNGQGVRGDLGMVIKAIYLDQEAIAGTVNNVNFGKVREPLLRAVHLWRAFDASSPNDRFQFNWPEYAFAQAPLSASHVFNFFSPDYAPPGIVSDNGLIAPELQIVTENFLTRTSNFFAYSTLWGHTEFEDENTKNQRILVDMTPLKVLVNDTSELLEYLNMLLLGGTMSNEMRLILTEAFNSTGELEINERLSNLLFLIMISPQYTVQR
ncbi:MAG: DUF1800 domain-containing protein [Colwellia sp.]|nr:DUF1800 domain-containing protein [Colwellia sp.]